MPEDAGRPWNLTEFQEERLKLLWTLLFKLFDKPILERTNSWSTAKTHLSTPSSSDSPANSSESSFVSYTRSQLDAFSSSHASESREAKSRPTGCAERIAKIASEWDPEDLRLAFWDSVNCDDPDGLLLRFLRARKWNVEAALEMFIKTVHWRSREMNVSDIIYHADHLDKDDDFVRQLRIGKCFIFGEDKKNRPVCYIRARLHKAGDVSPESVERLTVWVMETARLILKPPIETATIVFDMTDFSLSNMDYGPLKFMIKCFEAHYPECLGECIVHKAPWLFQGIWSFIKSWLDPVVVSKIKFTRNVKDLQQYIKADSILKEFGGPNPWKYTYPEPGQNESEALNNVDERQKLKSKKDMIAHDYEEATVDWILNGNPEDKQRRRQLAGQLIESYWSLDKYIRARSVYDRMGLIAPKSSHPVYLYQPMTNDDTQATREPVVGLSNEENL
ncbi:sec14 cytosolic factor family, phospholipid-intermembrane transfer protein Csr102 [Schizosaccharomyces osmophilus]|uniref:Sec14 cytosolic factor family, phospholipid-intermembrane transfer protein Csr102 n=1 Tax=Schizosaccharomyces osmophilus TaxID=2545709 RepID=A0AAF0AUZ5_9SCHI|nr:sec14 cytosolic factor family, phospholipid-intermembrane transfer protein Csr102 [Schizosaccharomyces osmophilus]WBW71435.1 sec14 cytosolic factor family, phospholipid-intermembrane transfer protein Csr102 [Schizosaccharomyces osmophilus]